MTTSRQFQIKIVKRAQKTLQKLPAKIRPKLVSQISQLSTTPLPFSRVTKLNSQPPTFRIRIGQYRIIYHINSPTKTITILRIGHRKDIYKS